MAGDTVCDPSLGPVIAWSCIDAALCSSVYPDITIALEITSTWSMKTDADASIVEDRTAVPNTGAAETCSDFAEKFGDNVDIGDQDNWCDADRVYTCTEAKCCGTYDAKTGACDTQGATDETPCTRTRCSTSSPGTNKYGVWTLLRSKASYTASSNDALEAQAETMFGKGNEYSADVKMCVEDSTFNADSDNNGASDWAYAEIV